MTGFFAAAGLEPKILSRRFKVFAAGLLLGGILIALAAAFVVVAAYLALAGLMAPWQAALIVAGGALVVGAILLVVAMKTLSNAVDQAQTAVRTNALVRATPVALRLVARNARLAAGIAAVAAALIALLRALSEKPKAES